MPCQEFEARLQQLWDARQEPEQDADLQAHASVCEACAELLAQQGKLWPALKLYSAPEAGELATAVLRAYAHPATASVPQATWFSRWAWSVSLVSVACAAWFVSHWNQTTPVSPGVSPAALVNEPPAVKPANAVKAASPVTMVAKQTPHAAKSDASLEAYREAFDSLATHMPPTPAIEAVNATLGPSLNPLRSSFGLTLDALRRTLPRSKEERLPPPARGAFRSPESILIG